MVFMKMIIQKWGVTIYILLLSLHLYAQVLGDQFTMLQFVTKVLLLPTLMIFLLAQNGFSQLPQYKWFIIIALFGSFLGDVLLTYPNYFIAGMIAFMTTHIFNILFFQKLNGIGQTKSTKFNGFTILLLAFCVLIFFQLKDAMGGLIYPILVYMALICSSALMAIHAGGNLKTTLISKLFWFPGMLFFITSAFSTNSSTTHLNRHKSHDGYNQSDFHHSHQTTGNDHATYH